MAKVNKKKRTIDDVQSEGYILEKDRRGRHFSCNVPQYNKDDTIHWVFPTELPSGILYMIGQLEQGKEDDYHHYQFHVYTRDSMTEEQGKNYIRQRLESPLIFVQISRDPKRSMDYTSKVDTRIEGPFELGNRPKGYGGEAIKKAKYREVVDAADSKEAEDKLKELDPRAFIVNYNNVQAFLKSKEKPKAPYIPKYTQFEETDNMVEWKEQINAGLDRCKVLLMVGPPRTGKSSWARSLGPHVYMSGNWNLKKFIETPYYEYVVFDDMNSHVEPERAILLGMNEVDLTDKYIGKKTINCIGKPTIWLCNHSKIPAWSKAEEYYLEDMIYEEVKEKLYK
jgi:hypothetical protein